MRLAPVVALLSILTLGGAVPLWGQQTGEEPPTRQELLRARQDSIQALMRERLLLLGRGPGADSATIAADSARLATALRRPGGPGATLQASDSIIQQLLGLEGYVATLYSGSEATFQAPTGMLTLAADSARVARVQRAGETVEADSAIDYDEELGVVRTRGMTTLQPTGGSALTTPRLYFDLDSESASALQARTSIDQNAQWYLRGDLPLVLADGGYGHDLTFTTCELDEPHYHFSAKEVKWARGQDSVLIARDVVLKFGEVPVFWFPFFAQNIGSGRRSGLLTPTFSVNDIVRTSGSYERRLSNLGYYWAMSDYTDLSLALDWFSGNYTAVTSSFRYNWLKKFLRGSLSTRQYWRAEGGSELSLSTAHDWELSERTRFKVSGRYATSTSFITRNSFNPAEVTGSVDSEGGVSHRFDWGTLTVNGSRRQFLSDDRVETTFPQASLSLRTLTLFRAPASRASWYNNMNIQGSAQFQARSRDLGQVTGVYEAGQEDTRDLSGSISTGVNLGGFSLSPGLNFQQGTVRGIPRDSIPFFADVLAQQGGLALISRQGGTALATDPVLGELEDVSRTTLDWTLSSGYQLNLISSTTLTPRASLAGTLLREDTVAAAQSFVAGPTRYTFGAELRGDLYGFYPGVGSYSAIRHKLSPSISWDYAPEVTPSDLQREVFGAGVARSTNVVALGLNQTFEAKRRAEEGDSTSEGEAGARPQPDEDGLTRLPQGEVVTLLGLRTTALRYDIVEADSTGRFIDGFSTTSLTNTITSDLVSGLSVTMTHSLFDESAPGGRSFSPKLTRLNFGFDLNRNTPILGLFGFLGGGDDQGDGPAQPPAPEQDVFPGEEDPFAFGGGLESSVVPDSEQDPTNRSAAGSGRVGEWSASFAYALTRGRLDTSPGSQTLQARLRLQPTELWQMSWSTSYDIDDGTFNDHSIRLTRNLHRWDANFDFVQTASGNWSFRFEVRLTDQEDLKFDYEQRSLGVDDPFSRLGGR